MSDTRYGVYALVDPRDELVRYVGQTCDFALRLKQHLGSSRGIHAVNPAKKQWLDELKSLNLFPVMLVLERNLTQDVAIKREATWVWRFLEQDMPLLNRKIKNWKVMIQDLLKPVAKRHGYSFEELATALGSGELATVLLPDEQRNAVIRWLDEQAKIVQDGTLAEGLKSLADQLYMAVVLESEME